MPDLIRPLRRPHRTPPGAAIRVGLCLASELWNQLLAGALAQEPGLEVVRGAEAAWSTLAPAPAAVLVTAVPLERAGWEQLAHWCRRETLRVLVLGDNQPALAARALRLGASGYLDGRSPLPALVKAIRGVYAGELWAERRVAMALLRPQADEAGPRALTPRELRVLEALAEGKRNKEIAVQLDISETTVKSHLNRAFRKLHVSDRLQAALYIERHGLG